MSGVCGASWDGWKRRGKGEGKEEAEGLRRRRRRKGGEEGGGEGEGIIL